MSMTLPKLDIENHSDSQILKFRAVARFLSWGMQQPTVTAHKARRGTKVAAGWGLSQSWTIRN
jgi:hypothetical protein